MNSMIAGVYSSHLDPQRDFSCLAVVLEMSLTPSQPQEQPLLYEQSLQLLYSLSEHLQSRDAMLTLLRKPPYSLLTSQIGTVLQAHEAQTDEVRAGQVVYLIQSFQRRTLNMRVSLLLV